MCSTFDSQLTKQSLIKTNKSYAECKPLKCSTSFDSLKTQIDCTANDLNSDTTLCASNIFDSDVTEMCLTNDKTTNSKTTNSYPKQWETVQTLDRSQIRSKQKVTDCEVQKKTTSTTNPLTYLKSALFPLKFKSKSKTSSTSDSKRTIRQSMSLIISNTSNSNNYFRAEQQNNNSYEENKSGSVPKYSPKVLYKCRSDESLESNPNSVCSCLSNCDVCNDIFNNCYVCQQISKYYANTLKLKSSELFPKQLIQSAINQISLAKCNCLSCVSHSCKSSSASGNKSQNIFIDSPLHYKETNDSFSSGIS